MGQQKYLNLDIGTTGANLLALGDTVTVTDGVTPISYTLNSGTAESLHFDFRAHQGTNGSILLMMIGLRYL